MSEPSGEIVTLEPRGDVIASLTPTERAAWRATGDLPKPKAEKTAEPSVVPAEATPAKPAEQAASTDASSSTASEPVTPKKANAETRKAELAAEIQALLKQRDELRASVTSGDRPTSTDDAKRTTAEPSPAAEVTVQQFVERPDPTQPRLTDAEFYTRFPDATIADFTEYVTAHRLGRERLQESRAQASKDFRGKLEGAIASAIKADPEFLTKAKALPEPYTTVIERGEKPTPVNVAMEEIIRSPKSAELLAYVGDHPDVFDGLTAPMDAVRTIARLEARLETPSVPHTPVVKTTTSAPPPPDTLGSKATTPADEVTAALASGDVRRYRRAMNAREAAG